MVAGPMDKEQREEFDEWLWSDPVREAKILADLGRALPATDEDGVTVIE